MYTINQFGIIQTLSSNGSLMFLPPEDNGTPEWTAYKEWLAEGNEPLPADNA